MPWIYHSHLLARRLGFRTWDDVEDMPHTELMLRLDVLALDLEVDEWKRKNPR